jgi:hypothetical protein
MASEWRNSMVSVPSTGASPTISSSGSVTHRKASTMLTRLPIIPRKQPRISKTQAIT